MKVAVPFVLSLFLLPLVASADTPNLPIGYNWNGTTIQNGGTYDLQIGRPERPATYTWPGGQVYGLLYQGTIHENAVLIAGHFMPSHFGIPATNVEFEFFPTPGDYFVVIRDLDIHDFIEQHINNWFQSGTTIDPGAFPPGTWGIIKFKVGPPQTPPTLSNLAQYQEDDVTPISPGAGFIGNSLILKADVTDHDSTAATLEVEVKPNDTPFDGTSTTFSATTTVATTLPATTTLSVTINNLVAPQGNIPADGIQKSFHWRARAIDAEGNTSEWLTFGSTDNNTDFIATYTIGQAAADLAKGVVTYSYTPGAKGWDVIRKSYVENADIKNGYNATTSTNKVPGTDCSGLIMWTYNKSFDATKPFTSNFITDEIARDQFADRQPIVESELRPGDQLFFDFTGDGVVDHVVMYVGGDPSADLVSARDDRNGIIPASESIYANLPAFVDFGRPQHRDIAMAVTAHSPVHLVVTDPSGNTIDDNTIASSSTEVIRTSGDLRYSTVGIDANGYPEDIVYSHTLKPGTYHIGVTPMANTAPTQTYSLDFAAGSTTIALAQNVPLSQIPVTGYGVVVGQDNSVTLDITPPEAHIGFSTSTKTIITTGSDDLSATTITTSASSTVVSDAAGNTLTLAISKNLTQSNYVALTMPSFAYSSGTTTLATTSLRYFWLTDKAGKHTLLISAIKTPADRVVSIYTALTNKTYVVASTPSDDTDDLSLKAVLLLLRKKLKTYDALYIPGVVTNKGTVLAQ